MYQVLGGRIAERAPQATMDQTQIPAEVKPAIIIPEEDVLLAAQQAKVSMEKARETLIRCEGDLAKAILMLQTG